MVATTSLMRPDAYAAAARGGIEIVRTQKLALVDDHRARDTILQNTAADAVAGLISGRPVKRRHD